MNSSTLTQPPTFIQNFTANESWFIPIDILTLVSSILIIVFATLFLVTILLDKTCHTIPMMLTANSYSSALIMGCILLSFSTFTLQNDLKRLPYPDSLCVFRGYIGYASYTLFNCSFFLQALHRYALIVHPTHLFSRSFRYQLVAIGLTGVYSVVYVLLFLVVGDITYNSDNQICQLVLRLSFSTMYGALLAYAFPMSLVVLIYFKLVRYVREMGKHVATSNHLLRARRELKMVRRTVIMILVLLGIAFPYILVMLMSFFRRAPQYHFRIAYISLYTSTLSVELVLFQFTEPLKASVMRRIKPQANMIQPAVIAT